MQYVPLFIEEWMVKRIGSNSEVWRENEGSPKVRKVWLEFAQNSANSCVLNLNSTLGTWLNMLKPKTRANFVFRSSIMDLKFWLEVKLQFQGTHFESMVLIVQVFLGHNSWRIWKIRSQSLQCAKSEINWMFDVRVVMSQNLEKRCWLFVIRKILSFSSKMTHNVLSSTKAFLQNWALINDSILK